MDYSLVFDTIRDGQPPWWLALGLLVPTVGLVMVWLSSHVRSRLSSGTRVVARVVVAFGGAMSLLMLGTPWVTYARFVVRLKAGDFRVVEGRVTDFRPLPENGHGFERFRIGRHEYAYSDNYYVPGFHQTKRGGGPIGNGVEVRITDVEGEIARLEIKKQP